MHWVSKVLIPVIAGGVGANAMEASVFSLSSSQYDVGSMTVSEDFARLALKLRMESPVASVLGATEANLEHLNQLAGSSQFSLFAGAKETTKKSLIILESSSTDIGKSWESLATKLNADTSPILSWQESTCARNTLQISSFLVHRTICSTTSYHPREEVVRVIIASTRRV